MSSAVKKKTTGQTVFEDIRDKIIAGEYPPGSHLPSERDLVSTLGISRGAIREAIQRLEQANLVTVNHGGGTKVNNYLQTAGLDLVVNLINQKSTGFDLKTVRSLIEMRTALGVDAAKLAAQRRSEQVKDDLLAKLEEMQNTKNPDQLQQLVLEVWDLIIDGSENVAYKLSMNTLRETYSKFSNMMGSVALNSFRWNDYQKLINAIASKHHVKAESIARTMVERDTKKILDLVDSGLKPASNG